MTNLRQCDECGAPVEEQDDGSAQCSACMMTYPDVRRWATIR